jgi:iron complex outermembrane recepter protein
MSTNLLLRRSRNLLLSSVAIVAGVGLASPSLAQTSTTTPPSAAEQAAEPELVVVTGSRLLRKGDTSPSPISTITAADIQVSGVTSIADLINRNPALGVPVGQFSFTLSPEATGISVLNLRNLGTDRSLTLVNGNRQVSSVVNSSIVDTFTIPTPLIARVEVSTGGASVAYGADAVTGVVNFILNRKFEGFAVTGQTGATSEGDGENQDLTAVYGINFADGRGNLSFSASYGTSGEIRAQAREWGRRAGFFGANPANTGPTDGIPDQIRYPDRRVPSTNETGLLLGAFTGEQFAFTPSGQLTTFNPGLVLAGISSGGDGFDFNLLRQIQNPNERGVVGVFVNYELTPQHTLSFDARYSVVQAEVLFQPTGDFYQFLDGTRGFFDISPQNPFLPSDPRLTALFAANPVFPAIGLNRSGVLFSKLANDAGYRSFETDRRTFQGNIALEGKLPFRDWRYNASYQYGKTTNEQVQTNSRISSRFVLAVDAVSDVNGVVPGNARGAPACRATVAAYTANPNGSSNAVINACKPLNIFGTGNSSQAARDYVGTNLTQNQELSQQVLSVNVTGSLFELPAGPVTMAAGVQSRQERSGFNADEISLSGDNFEGQVSPFKGSYSVNEVYSEISVPLLRNKTFARELTLEGGLRYSDYDTIGDTTTWRVGGSYVPVTGLRLRAAYAVAVRAPNIGELFTPTSRANFGVTDPCDRSQLTFGPNPTRRRANCLVLTGANFADPQIGVTKSGTASGNPNLTEETAKTTTAGFVFTPGRFGNFRLVVDYYEIEISDAIAQQNAQGILNGCVDSFDTTTNIFCALITRNATNKTISNITVSSLNTNGFLTTGVDFEASMRFPIARFGKNTSLALSLQGGNLLKLQTLAGIGATPVESKGTIGAPTWRLNGTATLNVDKLSFSLTTRWTDDALFASGETAEARSPRKLKGGAFYDIQANYAFSDRLGLFAGINNVANREPEFTFSNFVLQNSDLSGRYLYGGFRYGF